jgi:hypothetical protein
MADIDTGWFAVPATRTRTFGHSGKMFSILFQWCDFTAEQLRGMNCAVF